MTTAAYAVVDTFLWRPFAARDPDHVLRLTQAGRGYGVMSWADFSNLLRQQTSFSSLAASERRVAFGYNEAVDVVPLEVVGVVRGDFRGFGFDPLVGASAWLSVDSAALGRDRNASSSAGPSRRVEVKGRLADGVSRAMAASKISLIGQRLEQDHPAPVPFRQRRWSVVPLEELNIAPTLPIGPLFMLIVGRCCSSPAATWRILRWLEARPASRNCRSEPRSARPGGAWCVSSS